MKVLVTGGGGFLGAALVRALIARGDEVVTLQRGDYPELRQLGARTCQGDMTDQAAVVAASRQCELVYHVAGLTGVWGPYETYHRINVDGTRAVLEACRVNAISKLVYTSSPSVIFTGRDEENVDESMPYPDDYLNHYQRTKSSAEQLVLAANNDTLATVALRPHLIWGPGDPHLVARILDRARSGRLRLVQGSGKLVDTTFIDNAVEAHICAADRLDIRSDCAGNAYFITNGEPRSMADIINGILTAAGEPPVTRTISPAMLYMVGTVSEWFYGLCNIRREPMMTRFIARQLSCAHWYNIDAARRDLGYTPRISIDRGLELLQQAYQDNHDRLDQDQR